MAVKKRCPYCLKKLRPDGTCATKDCPRYVPEETEEEQPKQEEPAEE
jgi:hypothetical protein